MIEPFKPAKLEKIDVLPEDTYGKAWQLKCDGGNCCIDVELPTVKIYHMRKDTFNERAYRYPDLVDEIRQGIVMQNHTTYIGEICVLDEQGIGRQRLLMKRQVEGWKIQRISKGLPVVFFCHHIIRDKDEMLHTLPYSEILRMLSEKIHEGNHVKQIPTFNNPQPLLQMKNIEGLVIKDLNTSYLFGKRYGFKKKMLKEETVKFISYTTKDVGINLFTDENREIHLAGERVKIAVEIIEQKGYLMAEIEYLEKTEKGYRDCSIKRIGEIQKVEI